MISVSIFGPGFVLGNGWVALPMVIFRLNHKPVFKAPQFWPKEIWRCGR